MELKPKILHLTRRAYDEGQKLIASLSEEERSTRGMLEHWSPKDTIAHIATWTNRLANNIHTVSVGQTPTRGFDDFDEENKKIFEENRDRSWDEIVTLAETAHQAILEQVGLLKDSDLHSVEFLPWQEGRPLWKQIAGTVYIHPIFHLSEHYLARGDAHSTSELNESMAEALGDLSPDPDWQGLVKYNLACHYSLAGQKAKAISGLKEALRLNPGMVDWSKQDSDFKPVRDDPAYQALYAKHDET
jgi:hypothetical protein